MTDIERMASDLVKAMSDAEVYLERHSHSKEAQIHVQLGHIPTGSEMAAMRDDLVFVKAKELREQHS